LPPSERREFFDNNDSLRSVLAAATAAGSTVTLIPKAKNFPAIDAILPGNIFVNATLNTRHELLMQGKREASGIVPLAGALGASGTVTFVWALPHDRFEEACRRGTPATLVGAACSLRVTQLFLCVPQPVVRGVATGAATHAFKL
jgi:hypothetical protein